MIAQHELYEIDDSRERIQFDRVHAWLSEAYWSPGVPRERVEQAARGSAVVVGAYLDGVQVAYARVVSDCTAFAWLADVIVDEEHRGRGVGSAVVAHALRHPDLQGLRQWVLATKDAHEVYRRLGFQPTPPDRYMVWRP